MTLFLDAFLLALASSTDNFMVGLSVGISNQSLSFGANALISICNAAGALVASFGGSALGQSLPKDLPPLLSAIAFGGLALREYFEFWQTIRRKRHLLMLKKEETCRSDDNILNEDDDVANPDVINSTGSGKTLNMSRAMHLAIPMTLNNLAGGVAGTYSYAQMNIHAYHY
jgi:putative Mn2+ efflux pump MntP